MRPHANGFKSRTTHNNELVDSVMTRLEIITEKRELSRLTGVTLFCISLFHSTLPVSPFLKKNKSNNFVHLVLVKTREFTEVCTVSISSALFLGELLETKTLELGSSGL